MIVLLVKNSRGREKTPRLTVEKTTPGTTRHDRDKGERRHMEKKGERESGGGGGYYVNFGSSAVKNWTDLSKGPKGSETSKRAEIGRVRDLREGVNHSRWEKTQKVEREWISWGFAKENQMKDGAVEIGRSSERGGGGTDEWSCRAECKNMHGGNRNGR